MDRDSNKYSDQDETNYFDGPFDGDFDGDVDETPQISWKASEYIHHHKSPAWYAIFVFIALALAIGFFIILRDPTVVVLIAVMAVTLFVFANRQPRTLEYALSSTGLSIGKEYFDYLSFSSYSVMVDSGIFSIELVPLQRFKPMISIYFDPKDGEQIIDIIGQYLPAEQKTPDIIDRLIRLARF